MNVVAAVSPHSAVTPDGAEVGTNNILEIRNASNQWIYPHQLNQSVFDAIERTILSYTSNNPDAAKGFDDWLVDGMFGLPDVWDPEESLDAYLNREGRDEIVEILEKTLPPEGAGGVSRERWLEFARGIDAYDIRQAEAELGQTFAEYLGDGDWDIMQRNWDRIFSSSQWAAELRKVFGLESESAQKLRREIQTGQQFFPFAPPAEFQVESNRNVMRRIMTGVR
ncbi:MAG: hypothetical protein GF311_27620 [Candidatus Lokiarchaeota archaeon]|nr:hypothetical protein [Candidatus Lokiarchaeota archaeon]